jgi:GAF domain-containing protein
MISSTDLVAAVSAAVADSGSESSRLLQSIVDVARGIFDAKASSVFMLDGRTGELVFEAVCGEGENTLVGQRFPAGRGIAGWVVSTGEAIVVDDLAANQTFARDIAVSTGFVPQALMAVPLSDGDQVLGVLEILDPGPGARANIAELNLLGMFATQAAIALQIAARGRYAQQVLTTAGGEFAEFITLVQALQQLDGNGRAVALQLFGSLKDVVSAMAGG